MRKLKKQNVKITEEALQAFVDGDEYKLRRALQLPPYHASPLWPDLEGPAPFGGEGLCTNQTREAAHEIRLQILEALEKEHQL